MKFIGMHSFNLFWLLPDRNGLKRKPDFEIRVLYVIVINVFGCVALIQ